MVNYWLRSNSIENYKAEDTKLWEDPQSKQMESGDKLIMYVFDSSTQEKYLVGIYEFVGNFNIKPITVLSEGKWIERPELEEWERILHQSLKENTNFDLDKSQWVGRIASQGLKLIEYDFKKLQDLINKVG